MNSTNTDNLDYTKNGSKYLKYKNKLNEQKTLLTWSYDLGRDSK